METLLEDDAFSVELPKSGEIRQGTIASVGPGQILVSIGAKSEGVIAGRELEVIDAEDREAFEVGQEIPVFVVSPEDSNGNVVLSYKRAQEQMAWVSVEEQMGSDEIIESKIIGYNKGGLIVGIHGLRGFVPASQISAIRRSQAVGDTPEQRWSKMIGEEISVRIIEVDKSRRRLICSERAASNESRQAIKERVIEELQEGEVHTGRVTSLADFGAFVNINGADGLVHLSELSWDRIQHPKEILEVGQEVQVKVINIDREKKRIGLSLRALSDDPWSTRVEKYSVGQLVEGTITRLTKFGAFARLESDIEGLIHISEISDTRIEHPKEVLKEGEVVALRVIRIDPEQHRIGLSVRKVDSAAFADKDFKMLAQEIDQLDEEEPVAEVTPEDLVTEELEPKKPKAEESKKEKPKEEPKAEKAEAKELKAEEPKAEKPEEKVSKVEEPEAEEPKVEKPKAEEPKAEELKAEKPKAKESKVKKTKAKKPKAEEPKADKPVEEASVKAKKEPAVEESADPKAEQPAEQTDKKKGKSSTEPPAEPEA